jgi:hypothetical protein
MRGTIVLALSLTLLGCTQKPTAPDPVTNPDLNGAPSSIVVGGKTLTLTTSLWRDFMPISPPDGKPLIAVLEVRTADGSAVPADVRADMVWVVFGKETWSKAPTEERPRSETAPAYEFVARDGPKWGPGVEVDVVVRLRTPNGATYLLSVRKQRIGASS